MEQTIERGAQAALQSRKDVFRLLVIALLGILVIGSTWVILENPRLPVYDQALLLDARLAADRMPSPAKGLTSELVVALVAEVVPAPLESLNASVRFIAMLFYCGAATLLASALLRRVELVAAFVMLIAVSQFPFLWISSELFTAAYLFMAIYAWSKRAPPVVVGVSLACFALAKPDAVLVASVLLAFWAWRSETRRQSLLLIGGFVGSLVVLLAPGLVLHGTDYFDTWHNEEGRSFSAFRSHLMWMLQHFQIEGNPSTDSYDYVRAFFGDADSLWEVVTHPAGWFVYLEFVALAIVRGIVKTGYLASYSLLAVPVLAWAWFRSGRSLGPRGQTLLLCFVGVAPLVLLVYPHMRYMARFYPLYLIILLGAAERLAQSDRASVRVPALAATAGCLLLTLVTHAQRASFNLANVAHNESYWFPD